MERWVALADERLAGSGVRCLVSGGNDDFFEVDDVLRTSSVIEVPEGRVVDIDGHELIGLGYANPTPWDCPRDLPEPELGDKLERSPAKSGTWSARSSTFTFLPMAGGSISRRRSTRTSDS